MTSAAGTGGTSYSWDANGNSNVSGVVIGAGNRLLYDGTYTYTYDKNGNMLSQVSSTHETDYVWDQRNRLISVKDYSISSGTSTQVSQVDYSYDVFDRLQGRTLTTYGTGGTTSTARFVFDGKNMVLAFNTSGALTDRYLWGPAIDEILADEQFTPTTSGQLPTSEGSALWAMTDNLGTVRDLVNASGLVDHLIVDAFGNRTWQSNSSTNERIGYTGAFYDPTTGLIHDGVRWYKPSIERWLSEDPAGLRFDSNPYRYAANSPTNLIDPAGTATIGGSGGGDLTLGVVHLSVSGHVTVGFWWIIPMDVSVGIDFGGGPALGAGAALNIGASYNPLAQTSGTPGWNGSDGHSVGVNAGPYKGGSISGDKEGNATGGVTISASTPTEVGIFSDSTASGQLTGLMPWNPDAQWWFGLSNPLNQDPEPPPPPPTHTPPTHIYNPFPVPIPTGY